MSKTKNSMKLAFPVLFDLKANKKLKEELQD
jgi:hypothetical protein